MSQTSQQKKSESSESDTDELIEGPLLEPACVPNQTSYWRCVGCERESTRRVDLDRPAFHREGCACAELLLEESKTRVIEQ